MSIVIDSMVRQQAEQILTLQRQINDLRLELQALRERLGDKPQEKRSGTRG
ncbi:MAG TPA: hypothetical protein VML56_14525 [Burkholderiales bacterium]|nr:hypothetical protein [Burkholderiales bacterium]